MKNKVVVITGCSSGFGLLTALSFAKKGAKVIATMRDPAKSEPLLQRAQEFSCRDNIQVSPLDVTCPISIDEFTRLLTRVDVLVNNAGFACAGFSEDTSVAEYKKQLDTNFFGAIAVTNALLPLMREQQSGRIINVSSISGLIGFPGLSAYVASKHALEGWSECLRLELAGYGIKVSLIEPASYKTNIWTTGAMVAEKAQSPHSAYHDFYEKVQQHALDNQSTMGDPVKVAEKIVEIAQAKNPRLRYPVGKGIGVFILLKRILPWHWWQSLLLKTFK